MWGVARRRLLASSRQLSKSPATLVATLTAASMAVTVASSYDASSSSAAALPSHVSPTTHFRTAALLKLPGRLARDVYTAVAITADYMYSLHNLEPGSDGYDGVIAACHDRGAQRLLQLCFSNGGIYIKLVRSSDSPACPPALSLSLTRTSRLFVRSPGPTHCHARSPPPGGLREHDAE